MEQAVADMFEIDPATGVIGYAVNTLHDVESWPISTFTMNLTQ